jgi:hypothetical protein
MLTRLILPAVLMCIAASASYADQPCAGEFEQQLQDSQRFVSSLRPDKPGQMRVFAADGSEVTAGQVSWMRGRLRQVARLCIRGGSAEMAEAAAALTDVRNFMQSHHHRDG